MKVLKIGAVWCKECLVMKPMWEEIEKSIPGFEAEFFDADESPDILEKHSVKDIPTFIFFDKEGGEILRLTGIQNKDELIKIVKENLDK